MHVTNDTDCIQFFEHMAVILFAHVMKVVESGAHPVYVSVQYRYNVPKHVASLRKMSHVFRVGISAG